MIWIIKKPFAYSRDERVYLAYLMQATFINQKAFLALRGTSYTRGTN